MHEHTVQLKEESRVPAFLVGDLQSRLAYVDEDLAGVVVAADGGSIRLSLRRAPDAQRTAEIETKIERVIQAMVPGAVKPRQKVLEDRLDRPVPFGRDPLPALLEKGEVAQEGIGFAVLGPALSGLVDNSFAIAALVMVLCSFPPAREAGIPCFKSWAACAMWSAVPRSRQQYSSARKPAILSPAAARRR